MLPTFVTFKGEDPALFVISQNIHRRHLAYHERVSLGKKLLALESKRAKMRQKTLNNKETRLPPFGGKREKGTAAAKVAKAVGISTRSVERSIAIDKKAVPEVRKAVATVITHRAATSQRASTPKKCSRNIPRCWIGLLRIRPG